jgi:hypothetical protein
MPKWSEVPWGTVVTGVVAIYGAVLGTVNLFAQRSRDRQTAKEAQRKQAEQVIAWLVPDDGPEEPGRLFYGLALQNNSGRLVYEVIASIVMVRPGIGVQTRASEPQREDRPPMQFRSFVSQLPPGQTKTRIENPGPGHARRPWDRVSISRRCWCLLASISRWYAKTGRAESAPFVQPSHVGLAAKLAADLGGKGQVHERNRAGIRSPCWGGRVVTSKRLHRPIRFLGRPKRPIEFWRLFNRHHRAKTTVIS